MRIKRFNAWQLVSLLTTAVLVLIISPLSAQDTPPPYKDLVRVVIDQAYSYGNFTALDTVFAPDYVRHPSETDRDAFKTAIVALRAAVPDLTATLDLLIQEDKYVVARFHMQGTFTQTFVTPNALPVVPNNLPVQFVVNSIYRFNDEGLIVEEWNGFDNLSFLGQMGTIPAPPTKPEITLNYPDLVMTGLEIQNKTIAQQYFDAINQANFGILDTSFKGDFLAHNPFGSLDRSGLSEDWLRLRGALPDLNVSVNLMLSEGNWAAALYTMHGTFTNSFVNADGSSIPPTGNTLELPVVILFRFEQAGLVAESWELYDSLNFLTQLGLITMVSASS